MYEIIMMWLKLEGTGESFSESKSSKPSGTEIFKPKYLKRIVLATAISTLQECSTME